jgi:hypothetical protein
VPKKTVIWNGDQATTYIDGKPVQIETGSPATGYQGGEDDPRPLNGIIKRAVYSPGRAPPSQGSSGRVVAMVEGVRLSDLSLIALSEGDEAVIRRLALLEDRSPLVDALHALERTGCAFSIRKGRYDDGPGPGPLWGVNVVKGTESFACDGGTESAFSGDDLLSVVTDAVAWANRRQP